MSGITPLIDTLLHQVLGRQAEVSTQRALNAPVQPVYAGDGPRALQGDAGLDGRPLAPLLGDLKRLPGSPDGFRQAPPGTLPGNAPSSTQTHFSPAARTIADVLLRFPAPPTVLRPQAPGLTHQTFANYLVSDASRAPELADARAELYRSAVEINEQDLKLLAGLQQSRSMDVSEFLRPTAAWDESNLRFQRLWAREFLAGG